MRALGLSTKIAAACGVAAALLASLGLSWYGPIPAEAAAEQPAGVVSGPLDGLFAALPRWLSQDAGSPGWELAGRWDTMLACLAALAFLSALLCLLPATEHGGRALLQLTAFGSLGIVAVKLLLRPEGFEPRVGIFAALALSLLLTIIASGVAASKLRRKPVAPKRYAGTGAPAPYPVSRSKAPPGL
jgi:hypothetical protein